MGLERLALRRCEVTAVTQCRTERHVPARILRGEPHRRVQLPDRIVKATHDPPDSPATEPHREGFRVLVGKPIGEHLRFGQAPGPTQHFGKSEFHPQIIAAELHQSSEGRRGL